ncbi:MAG: hypothetical protein C4523_13475 [Myxococcales bacterium]|nr:MAG: hypothetical protein C4523_13475 [Myxococcales bacterium]
MRLERIWRKALFLAATLVALTGCLYGSPDDAPGGDGDSTLVNPDQEGVVVSEDGRVFVQFPAGAVDRPTEFSITRIPQSAFPDEPRLVSDVYQMEPTRELAQTVRVTMDLFGLDGRGHDLPPIYGTGGLAVVEIVPGQPARYLATDERDMKAQDNALHRVLMHNTSQLTGYGVFVHDCYLLCEKAVGCPGYSENPNMAPKERIIACMDNLGCPDDLEKVNGDEMRAAFACAKARSCDDAYTCCLESKHCEGEPDGDEDGPDTDGDIDEADQEPDIDDVETDGDVDNDTDIDEIDDTPIDWSVKLCQTDEECGGQTCVFDLRLDNSTGYCAQVPKDETVELFRRDPLSGWLSVEAEPELTCVNQEPVHGGEGDTSYQLKVSIDDWWKVDDPTGIRVQLYYEFDLEGRPALEATTGEDGTILFDFATDPAFADEWFVLKSDRRADAPGGRVMPTWEWGLHISRARAAQANDLGAPVEIKIHPVEEDRYQEFANALGIAGVPAGYGMALGQIADCYLDERRTIARAVVGFKEVRPVVTGYFSAQLDLPTPSLAQLSSNKNGLFIGVYMPPQEPLTAFAAARVLDGDVTRVDLMGVTLPGHLRLDADSVSIVRFNRYE